MITILADQHIPYLETTLGDVVKIVYYNSDEGFGENLRDTDVMIIRTVTKIDKTHFPIEKAPNLKLIASPSAGFDHVDTEYLSDNNVQFTNAAGCNAWSVAEYVATVLIHWSENKSISPENIKVGIVGAGHTGSAANRLLNELGFKTILFDPPRDLRDSSFKSASLEEVLRSNVLTFHTPLIFGEKTNKSINTFHWLDSDILDDYSYKLIINAARGGIVDEQALLKAKKSGKVDDFILDVWENEPDANPELIDEAYLATPHIAGYSLQAKFNASRMVSDAIRNFVNVPDSSPNQHETLEKITLTPENPEISSVSEILENAHPLFTLSHQLKKGAHTHPDNLSKTFNELRTKTPLRTEFRYIQIPDIVREKNPLLNTLFPKSSV